MSRHPASFARTLIAAAATSCCVGLATDPVPEFSYYPDIAAPDHLLVIDRSDMSLDEYLMVISLQGLLAQEKPRIYITGHDPAYALWLDEMKESYGVTTAARTSGMSLLGEFKDEVSGYILCRYGDPSVNSATSLAGIRNAVVVTESLVSQVQALGLPRIMDVRNIDHGSVFDDFKDEFNNSLIFTAEHGILEMRDMVVASRGFIFHETDEIEGNFFDE